MTIVRSNRPTRPTAPRPTGRAALATASVVLALGLTGCGIAEQAVQEQASQVVDEAKGAASAKASELAVAAVKTQICTLVKDGALSDADAKALDGLATAGTDAGLPAELVELVKSIAEAGTAATSGQVSDLQAQACQ